MVERGGGTRDQKSKGDEVKDGAMQMGSEQMHEVRATQPNQLNP